MEVFELHEWLETDFRAVERSWSSICLIGGQDAIDAANRLMTICAELIDAATATDESRGRVARLVKGEVPSADQLKANDEIIHRLYREREAFASLIRRETGQDPVAFPIHAGDQAASPQR